MSIKKEDKILLLTKNLINNKLNNFYVKAFLIKKIKEIITLFTLSNMKIFLKFHISLFKKILLFTFLITI